MQGTADQAAYSVAVTYGTGGRVSPTTQAKGVTTSFGFVDGTGAIYAASQEVDYTGSSSATSGWSVVERPRWDGARALYEALSLLECLSSTMALPTEAFQS